MQVRVIHTASQSFLESNIPDILAIILNTSPENIFGQLSFPEDGGFIYFRNQNIKDNPASTILKDKESVKKGLNNLFTDKNKRIVELFSNQKSDGFETPFFPTQYLELISTTPHFNTTKKSPQLTSWSTVYKLKVPPFGANESGKTKYVTLANADLLIKIRVDGVIEEIRYNFLPLEQYQYLSLNEPAESDTETSDLIYLFNKDKRVVAPFWLSLTAQPFLSATKFSILPEYLNRFSDKKNSIEFDENRVVVWLGTTENNKKLKIKDASSKGIIRRNIKLPPGAKLIRLKPESAESENTPCLYWWNEKYHLSEFPEKSLISNNSIVTEYSGKILQNDIQHLLERVKSHKGQQPEFDDVINKIEILSKKQLSKKEIENLRLLMNNKLHIDLNNKPDTIKRYREAIFSVYNPVTNESYFSDECLIIPLTFKWFHSDIELIKYYKSEWETSENLKDLLNPEFGGDPDNLMRGGGTSGEGLGDGQEDRINQIKQKLLELKAIVKDTTLKQSPEAQWLYSLSSEYMNNIKSIVVINDATWRLYNEKYGDFVAIENSFGILRFPGLLSIIIHELKMSSGSFLDIRQGQYNIGIDTHIAPSETENYWTNINHSNWNEKLSNIEAIDSLYQSHRFLASINLAIITQYV